MPVPLELFRRHSFVNFALPEEHFPRGNLRVERDRHGFWCRVTAVEHFVYQDFQPCAAEIVGEIRIGMVVADSFLAHLPRV